MQGDLIFPALEYGVVPLLGVTLAEALENLLRRTNKKAGNGANQQIAETEGAVWSDDVPMLDAQRPLAK